MPKFGWIRDPNPPVRALKLFVHAPLTVIKLPSEFSMRKVKGLMPRIYNQGDLGSCVANAVVAGLEILDREVSDPAPRRSRLQVYYNARRFINTQSEDSGCIIRDAFRGLNIFGAAPESLWPYHVQDFAIEPPPGISKASETVTEYYQVNQDVNELKLALINQYAVVIGLEVFESFLKPNPLTHHSVPLPSSNEQYLGGHAVLLTGYDDKTMTFEFRNSWGYHWADKGYARMPYSYLTSPDLSGDFWAAQKY